MEAHRTSVARRPLAAARARVASTSARRNLAHARASTSARRASLSPSSARIASTRIALRKRAASDARARVATTARPDDGDDFDSYERYESRRSERVDEKTYAEEGVRRIQSRRAVNFRDPKTLFACVAVLVMLGSLAQGSNVSVVVRRLVTVALIRVVFRRAYRFTRDAVDSLASLARRFDIRDVPMDMRNQWRLLRIQERTNKLERRMFNAKDSLRGKLSAVLSNKVIARAVDKFNADRKGMLLIPLVAAFVGWFTNWLAVKMIFYPINFLGIPLFQYVEGSVYGFDILQPLGILGWQGIVPAKAAQMSLTMVTMVTEKLVNVQAVFMLLDPTAVSSLLLTEVPNMASKIASEMIPDWSLKLAESAVPALPTPTLGEVGGVVSTYLSGFVTLLQQQVDHVIDLKELVVTAMCTDRVVLVDLFRRCGAAELDFLVNSGLFFGFLLGVIQMVVWAFYDNPWSITIGGMIVGLLTNWLALKCIFEPVEPVFVGPFKIQGLFLQRQHEVSGTFSDYLTEKVLKSENIWNNMLNGDKGPEFNAMLEQYTKKFVVEEAAARGMSVADLDVSLIDEVCRKVVEKLPEHIHVLHEYTDATLGLKELMRERMKLMTPQEFERVLHPIFEQDELTLIISGAVLGAAAGYIQQIYSVKPPADD